MGRTQLSELLNAASHICIITTLESGFGAQPSPGTPVWEISGLTPRGNCQTQIMDFFEPFTLPCPTPPAVVIAFSPSWCIEREKGFHAGVVHMAEHLTPWREIYNLLASLLLRALGGHCIPHKACVECTGNRRNNQQPQAVWLQDETYDYFWVNNLVFSAILDLSLRKYTPCYPGVNEWRFRKQHVLSPPPWSSPVLFLVHCCHLNMCVLIICSLRFEES